MKIHILFALVIFLFPALAVAEEELYAPVPPADSSFVRAIGDITIDGSSFPERTDADNLSDFIVVTQGNYELWAGGEVQSELLEAGKYYTLAKMADQSVKIFEDALIENPSKAMIYFYNLSDAPTADLSAPDHKANIFEQIKSEHADSREINAVTFNLAVKPEGAAEIILEGVELKRQIGTSIILRGAGGDYTVDTVTNMVSY